MKKQGFWTKQRYVKELTPVEHTILWTTVVLSVLYLILDAVYSKHDASSWKIYVSFAASIVSIFSVMAGVKKKPLCPLLGIIGSLLLIPIAWADGLMATMIMFCINTVAQSISLVTWIKNSDSKSSRVKVVEIKWWLIVIYITALVGLTALYTWVEGMPEYVKAMSFGKRTTPESLQIRIFDSATLMFTIGCFIPMMFRWKIVWVMYILNDAAQIATWICRLAMNYKDFHNWMMLISVLSLLATSILGLVRWYQADFKSKK